MFNLSYLRIAAALVLVFSAGRSIRAEEIHITQSDAVKAAKDKVQPDYPAMARQLHIEGAVQVEAHIGEGGLVEECKPLTGNALLMNAAMAALKKWKFIPFTTDGKPTRAVADISFNFKL